MAQESVDLQSGSLLKKMLVFALPLMATNALQLMFNAADIAIIGHFGSEHSLAAIGVTPYIVAFLLCLFAGLTVGTNVLASVSLGARNFKQTRRIVHTSLAVALIAGAVTALFGQIFIKTALIRMQTPEVVLPLTLQYTRIYFIGMIPIAVYNFGATLLYAKGDTKRPLMFLTASGALNVVLNIVFVVVFKLDVAGVACATLISQTLAAALIVLCLSRQKDATRLYVGAIRIDGAIAGRILRLGLPAALQGIAFSLSNIIIQSAINSFGPTVIAGAAASANLEEFIWVCMAAFGQTATTFISRGVGAKQYGLIDPIRRRALACVCLTGIGIGWPMVLCGKTLLHFYTSSGAAVDAGFVCLSICGSFYFIGGLMDVAGGSLRGLGKTLEPGLITLFGACGLRLLWIATYFQIPENHTLKMLYVSYPLSWGLTTVVLYAVYLPVRRKFPKESVKKAAA